MVDASILREEVSKHLQASDTGESGEAIVKCMQINGWHVSNDEAYKGLIHIVVELKFLSAARSS
jgi:hypothetical protein